jgi:hypothetical protein
MHAVGTQALACGTRQFIGRPDHEIIKGKTPIDRGGLGNLHDGKPSLPGSGSRGGFYFGFSAYRLGRAITEHGNIDYGLRGQNLPGSIADGRKQPVPDPVGNEIVGGSNPNAVPVDHPFQGFDPHGEHRRVQALFKRVEYLVPGSRRHASVYYGNSIRSTTFNFETETRQPPTFIDSPTPIQILDFNHLNTKPLSSKAKKGKA